MYIGNKHERTVGEAYDELLDEFVDAVKRRFGERCVIQFEDFSNANGKRLLERYASRAAVFNDDIHGVAATAPRASSLRDEDGEGRQRAHVPDRGRGETGTGAAMIAGTRRRRRGEPSPRRVGWCGWSTPRAS